MLLLGKLLWKELLTTLGCTFCGFSSSQKGLFIILVSPGCGLFLFYKLCVVVSTFSWVCRQLGLRDALRQS